jgi:hypothetical protein
LQQESPVVALVRELLERNLREVEVTAPNLRLHLR